jgi:hypothetical protein
MSAASDYLENKWLEHLFKSTAYAGETTLYVGLFASDPGESGVTGEFVIGAGAYARVAITNDELRFPPCSISGVPTKTNGTLLSFPAATSTWGTATHWAIYSAATGATNMLAHGALATPFSVNAGKTPKIPVGAISLTINNGAGGGLTDYSKRKILDLTFGKTSFPTPAAVYIGIGTALSGETLTQWTDLSYSRQLSAFTVATAGSCSNSDIEEFTGGGASSPTSTTITHYGIWDDSSAGNLLAVGPLGSSRLVLQTDTVSLAIGAAVITLQ